MNDWKNIKSMIEYPNEGILSKEVFKNDKVNVTLFCMARGTALSEHTSPKSGQVLVIDGEGIFNLENEEIKMEEGVLITMSANAKHSLKAIENTAFILFLNS